MSPCRVTICFSGDYLVNMHSCTQAWRAWILPAHLVSSFEHHCADPTSYLPRLGVTACLAAQPTTWPWSRYAGPTSGQGTGQCLHTESMSQMRFWAASGTGACSWCRTQLRDLRALRDGLLLVSRDLTEEVEDWNWKPVSTKPTPQCVR